MIKIVAIIGEAGTGKDTIMQHILARRPGFFNEIVSCTTRPMREGEVHGVNYFYYTIVDFLNKVGNGEMLESTCFNNWYYGTSKEALSKDKINIGVFNPAGIRSILKFDDIELNVYRISCRDKVRLIRQLNREENPDVDEVIRRYGTDKEDFSNLNFYYNEIENNDEEDLELAVSAIIEDLGLA